MAKKDYRLSKLFKVYSGVSETKQNREVFEETIKSGLLLDPSHLLTYFDHVPNGSEVSGGQEGLEKLSLLTKTNPTIFFQEDETTSIPIVTKHFLLPFTPVGPESPKSFKLVKDGKAVQHIIPYNYCEDYYIYRIYKDDGLEIPFGVGNWVLDTFSGILTFYDELPEGVDSEHPPLITCFQYVGGTGYKKQRVGLQGVVLPVVDFPIEKNTFATTGIDKKLKDIIELTTNKIEDDFVEKYGWDGADDNEGVALSYEKVIPLRYSSSKDSVKGYDFSADASVGAVVSRKVFRALDTRKIITKYKDSLMPSLVGGRPAVEMKSLVKKFDDYDFTTPTAFENKKELYKHWVQDLQSDQHLELDLEGLQIPMVLEPDNFKNELDNFERFLEVVQSQNVSLILDLSKAQILEDDSKPVVFKYFIHPTLEDKANKIYSQVKGITLPSVVKVVGERALAKFENLSFLNFSSELQSIEAKAISGKFDTFYFNKIDFSDQGIFKKASIKKIYLNSKDVPIFFGNAAEPTLGNTEDLENIFIYDSAFERYLNSSWKDLPQKDRLIKLSTNPNFPLIAGSQEVDVVSSDWKGKVEYVNNSASSKGKKCFLFYQDKKAWIEVDGIKERETEIKPLENPKTVVQGKGITAVVDFTGITENCRVEFELYDSDPYVALFYWSTKQQKYVPFTTKEDSVYDFGFPVVTQIGKIPPSLEFLNNDILSFGKDELTPDYYGPRIFQKVLAASDTPQHLSNDYVVKEKELYYLDQYLKQLFDTEPNFEGTIFLRQGTYVLKNPNIFVLPAFKNLKFIGEDKALVSLKCKSFNFSNVINTLILKGINFGEECVVAGNTSNLKTLSISDISLKDLSITKDKPTQLFVNDLVLENFSLESLTPCNSTELNTDGTFSSRIVNIQAIKTNLTCDNTYIVGLITREFTSQSGKTLVNGSQITKVLSKSTGTQITGSDVRFFDPSVATDEVPSEAHFKIWKKLADGQLYQRYTRFEDPFNWDPDTGLITIKLDPEVLYIDSQGRISTNLKASDIAVNPDDYTRDETAIDPDTGKKVPVTATTLKEALQDLFLKKADLIKGKIPLRQLPDAVAYGGLHYCGVWSFDDHSGAYPTFTDITTDLSVEDHIKDLQPGWFFIINPPKSELDKPEGDDSYSPTRKQIAVDGTEYTAGDWMVYVGKVKETIGGTEVVKDKFEKIDRAYQDAAYSILPALDPDGKKWNWKEFGDGWLNFGGVTITEAFDLINEFLLKSVPRKGLTINDSQIYLEHAPLAKREVFRISPAGVGDKVELYLLSDNPDFTNSFKFHEDPINDWKNYVYFSEYGTVQAILDGRKLFEKDITDEKDLKEPIGTSENILTIRDIHANENSGIGFWRGFRVDIKEPLDPTPGDHTLTVEVLDRKPDYEPVVVKGNKSVTYHLDEEPYRLEEVQLNQVEKPRIEGFAQSFFVSGVPYFILPFIGNFRINLTRAAKNFIKDSSYFELKADQEEEGEIKIMNVFSKFKKNIQDGSFLDLDIEGQIKLNSIPFLKSFSLDQLTVWGFKEEVSQTFTNLFVENTHTFVSQKVDENERVSSGETLYPEFDSTQPNQCGFPFDSNKLLSAAQNELQKRLYLTDQEIFTQYEWPKEKFFKEEYKINYEENAKHGVVLPEISTSKEYRFATFTKFNGREVVLDHASGFTLRFDSRNPEVWESALDINTNSTKDLILQIKLIDGATSTPWFDANSPYDGYSQATENGDSVMYAGLSNALVKRVTFGKKTFSGKLCVRVGTTRTTGFTFTNLSVEKIV